MPTEKLKQQKKDKKEDGNNLINNNLESFLKSNSGAESATIWRANQSNTLSVHENPRIDTGFKDLNQLLTLSGWPLNGINELNLEHNGIGELRLLLPALQTFKTQNVLLIAPPFLPFAPALTEFNIQTEHWIIAQTESIQDRLWAAEQALLSDTCSAVLCWTGRHLLNHRELRRLQLASKKNCSWFLLLRDQSCLKSPSPASLRLHLKTNKYGQLRTKLIKQIGGSAGQNCTLSLAPYYENWQRLPAHLWPQSNTNKTAELINKPKHRHNLKSNTKLSNITLSNNTNVVVLRSLSELQNVY